MYADRITDSMRQTIDETNRRREKQLAYNEAHGITPKQITRSRANALLDIEKQSSQENSSKPKEPRAYTETEAQLMQPPTLWYNICQRASCRRASNRPAS